VNQEATQDEERPPCVLPIEASGLNPIEEEKRHAIAQIEPIISSTSSGNRVLIEGGGNPANGTE